MGGRNRPCYRIVAADTQSPRDGRFLEILGNYDPQKDPPDIVVREERVRHWFACGARPTMTVSRLLEKKGVRLQRP